MVQGGKFWHSKWSLEVGCLKEVQMDEIWVKILGLPFFFLWDKGFFKQFGDACGGFVAVGEDIADCCKL